MSELTPEAQVIETLFHVQPKQGPMTDFVLNPSQRDYDSVRTPRDLIAKCRQKGYSTLGIAYMVVKCLSIEGTKAVLISHEAFSTQRLLDKARFFLDYIKGPKPVLGRRSRNEFFFPKTESTLYIGTAGAKAFGRGDTITDLHISEYPWWESTALKVVAGLFQAVPAGGTIRIEATGNGKNNDFYYISKHADQLGYQNYFRGWWQDDEYTRKPVKGWDPEGFENYFQDMQTVYNLTEPQLYWYWMKLLEFRLDLPFMQQEYPSCLDECFQATGGSVFSSISSTETKEWDWRLREGVRVEYLRGHPIKERRTYVIGADPSGGTGNDDAAIQIFCLETLEQVFELANNHIDPVDFGWLLCDLGEEFNNAYIICEGNHHGIATHSILKKNYNRMKLYKRHIPTKKGKIVYGYYTSESTKPELVGAIQECTEMGITIHGKETVTEMDEFEETPEGKMGGPKDNRVIALGLACVGILKWRRFAFDLTPPVPKPEPIDHLDKNYMFYTFDEVFKDLDKRRQPTGPLPRMVH